MKEKEPYKWITVKGKHIPVYKDEFGKDVFGNGHEEYKSSDDMVKRVVGENNAYFSEERAERLKEIRKYQNERNNIDKQIDDLQEQLETETTIERDEEADEMFANDWANRYIADMFVKKTYTEKGEELRKQISELEEKKKRVNDRLKSVKDLHDVQNDYERSMEMMNWLQRISSGKSTIQDPTQKEYQGFKLAESTTTNVDSALKSGKARVVEMSPMEYLERANYEIFRQYTLAQNIAGRSYEDVNKYAEMMRQGVKFDTPYLNYYNEGQEGIHRALAAIQNGYEKIPVIIVRR